MFANTKQGKSRTQRRFKFVDKHRRVNKGVVKFSPSAHKLDYKPIFPPIAAKNGFKMVIKFRVAAKNLNACLEFSAVRKINCY